MAEGPVRPFSQPETLHVETAEWALAPRRVLWYFSARPKSLLKIPIRATIWEETGIPVRGPSGTGCPPEDAYVTKKGISHAEIHAEMVFRRIGHLGVCHPDVGGKQTETGGHDRR